MMEDAGKFDARYMAFLEAISQLRPQLHRYCARMTGAITDGEDVVQDALFRAYLSLDTYDDRRALAPWLFPIAHNHCIDFLRRRGVADGMYFTHATRADRREDHVVAKAGAGRQGHGRTARIGRVTPSGPAMQLENTTV